MTLDKFFDDAARARIAEAVKTAELESHGEIVPLVVDRCETYPQAAYRGALLFGAVATLVALVLHFPWGLGHFVTLQVAAGLVGAAFARIPGVERMLAGSATLDRAALERAELAFVEHGLHRTTHRTGVLVFASLTEHRAIILGDKGIDEKMGKAGWDHAVAALAQGLAQRQPAEGFVQAISECGAKLKEHFPRAPGSASGNDAPVNELSDELRTERH